MKAFAKKIYIRLLIYLNSIYGQKMKQIGFQLLPLDARHPLPVAEEASGLWNLRAGIILVEVYERVGKFVIWVCERAQRAEQMNFMGL